MGSKAWSAVVSGCRVLFSCVILRRTDDWKRWSPQPSLQMIRMCFSVYTMLSELPTWLSSGMGRCFADWSERWYACDQCQTVFTGSCAKNALLLERKPLYRHPERAHTGKVAVKEKQSTIDCSDGFEFRCDNGENCESRSRWTAAVTVEGTAGAVTTGGFDSETIGRNAHSGGTPLTAKLPASPVE